MPEIKAIIFDMDGVLIEAKEWHYDALNRALGLFGFEISRYDHLITYDGLPTRTKLDMLSMEQGLPKELHEFLNELKQIYTLEIVHTKCKPVFQHEYALSKLKSMNYSLGLASNSVRESVETMMKRSNLINYFDVMLSNQDVSHPKPAPDIYLTACKNLAIHPEQCLVVEDNENGIMAARDAKTNLMIVNSVYDVTLENIIKNIEFFEGKNA